MDENGLKIRISEMFREYREKYEGNNNKLAEKLGIDRSTLSKFLNKKRLVEFKHFFKLCEIINYYPIISIRVKEKEKEDWH